jgi:hypothetical protein
MRKHVDGRRLVELVRPAGHRALVLDLGDVRLVLRLSGAPALSLVKGEAVLATMGEGAPAWPLPSAPAASPESLLVPCLALPRPYDACRDRDLAPADAVRFVASAEAAGHVVAGRWSELAALFLVARRRGARFEAAQRGALRQAARELRRLRRLEAHLEADLAGLGDATALRQQAEAILAAPGVVPRGVSEAELPDPRSEGSRLRVSLDPRLEASENATRLFARARRLERARQQVGHRLAETRREIESAAEGEARALAAEDVGELTPPASAAERAASDKAKPRHYLTSRGLSILVGRGARENHRLTFSVARPEDLWLHVRDAPGAHVILRDPEGRADADDLREAAETAAYFSDVRDAGRVDVHVARRKHVRPARGGPGRVHVSHSDTLRVAPRDPQGQLRRR